MYFVGREIKPYVEPVSSEQLHEGTIYFAVNYVDEELLIPMMETVVFIGRNLKDGDVEKVYFQDVSSYRNGVKYDWEITTDARANFYSGSEHDTGHIFEYQHALNSLLRCLLNRRNMPEAIPMHFEGRELKSYSEPVLSSDLEEGSVYFALNYADEAMQIPVLETLVFVGRDLDSERSGRFHFQDVESYREEIPYGSSSESGWARFHSAREDEMSDTFTFEGVLDELMRCSLRRTPY